MGTDRSRRPPRRSFSVPPGFPLFLTLALLLLVSLPAAVSAQAQGRIAGQIIGPEEDALSGAQVSVEGTNLGALTDAEGRFEIRGIPGDTVRLQVRLIGYATRTRRVAVGNTDVRIRLRQSAVELENIVVTGTAGQTRNREIGNAIEQLEINEVTRNTRPPNLQQVMQGQAPSVRLNDTGGEVGAGANITIRGVGSIALSSQPLVYIDGVRLNNRAISTGPAFDNASAPSRLNDIKPAAIASYEVIKGPSAATIYGTEASNGVINITTKKGGTHSPRFTLNVSQGGSYLPNASDVFPPVYGRDPRADTLISLNIIENDKRLGFGSPFSTGHNQQYTAQLRGGTDQLNYFVLGDWDRDEGIVSYNWQNQLSTRANLQWNAAPGLSVTANTGVIDQDSRAASAQQPITTHIIWGLPQLRNTETRGYLAVTPDAFEDAVSGIENLTRFTESLSVDYSPYSWLENRLTAGVDQTRARSTLLFPRTPEQPGPHGQSNQGLKQVERRTVSIISLDYGTSLTADLTEDISLETSLGAQWFRTKTVRDLSEGITFPVPGLTTTTAGATKNAEENFVENRTFGVYVQERIGLNDRLFLTGAVRGDDNSAFGSEFEFVVYPKVSASWVVSEEPFWNLDAVNALKLRAAWGESGQQPEAFSAIRTFRPAPGPGEQSGITPENVGNPELEPEVGSEIEVGFDATLLEERLTLQATYFDQERRKAIIPIPTLPSEGFPGERLINGGEITNRGVETSVQAQLLDGEEFGWSLGGMFSWNDNVVERISGDRKSLQASTIGGGIAGQRHVEGYPIGSFFLPRVVQAEFGPDGQVVNVRCEGGQALGGGGGPVPCSEAANAYRGRPTPEWLAGLHTQIRFLDNFTLYAQADLEAGHARCNGNIGFGHLFFRNTRAINTNEFPILHAYDQRSIGGSACAAGMQDAGFAKLRSLSARYQIPPEIAQIVGGEQASVQLRLRNGFTLWEAQSEIFGREVIDPEVSRGDPIEGFIQEQWPQITRLEGTVEIRF